MSYHLLRSSKALKIASLLRVNSVFQRIKSQHLDSISNGSEEIIDIKLALRSLPEDALVFIVEIP